MKKESVGTGKSLNEIIAEAYKLATKYSYAAHTGSIGMGWASNQESHNLTITCSCGGYHETGKASAMTKDQVSLYRQGFGVIQFYVRALWGGHFYEGEPIEGTAYHILIVDRRDRWDAGSWKFVDFEKADEKLAKLMANPPAKLIGE